MYEEYEKLGKYKTGVYLRKSTEDDSKQIQSIEDQSKDLEKVIKKYSLKVVEKVSEEKSAKTLGREKFANIVSKIEKGDVEVLLVWHINRLSRNPVDSGTIQYLLQEKKLKAIITPEKVYWPDDNALMMALELASSNQFSRDLSKTVTRGLNSKVEKGHMPSRAPLGYKNTKSNVRGENKIIPNEELFSIVQLAFNKILSENYRPEEVLRWLNDDMNVRTPSYWKKGDRKIGRSTLYSMLRNPFYAGKFLYRDKIQEGSHEPMITWQDHLMVQKIISGERSPMIKSSIHEFFYKGLLSCPECGCGVTSSKHHKKISTGEVNTYISYHCTKGKNKNGYKCANTKSVSDKFLDDSFSKEISSLYISENMHKFMLDLAVQEFKSIDTRAEHNISNLEKDFADIDSKLNRLSDMYLKEMIDETEYKNKKSNIMSEKEGIKNILEKAKTEIYDPLKTLEDIGSFAKEAENLFKNGDGTNKKSLMRVIGSDYKLIAGQIAYAKSIWTEPFRRLVENTNILENTFGTELSLWDKGETINIESHPIWCGYRDLNPN